MEKEKKHKGSLNGTVIGVAQRDITQTHGEAASQMIQAQRGVRYDSNGAEIIYKGRSLDGISNSKVNPDYEYSNLKQQSGFSAELLKEARDNKDSILNGENTRTRNTDGIGKTNDPKHDHVKVDENNNPIPGTESQMKFKGRYSTESEIKASSENIVKDMVSDKWEKYSDSPMDIPIEQVEHAREFARKEATRLRETAKELRDKGDIQKAELLEEKAIKYEKAEKNIRDSGVSSEEAMEARTNHKKFVAKEVAKDSHNAGLEAAKGAFVISGAISGAQNIISVVFEEKSLDEAALDVLATTSKASAMAYGIGATGTVIKSFMHSSKNSVTRALGKTNAPAMMATAIVEIGKSLKRYASGEIGEEELLEELGEKGTGMVAASYASAVGTFIMPGIGTVIGGMIGYTVSSLLYNESLNVLKSARISEERRRVIENFNEKAIAESKRYQEEIKTNSQKEYLRRDTLFGDIFKNINYSIMNNNIDSLFMSINELGEEFGISLQFKNFKEFDKFMSDDDTVLTI